MADKWHFEDIPVPITSGMRRLVLVSGVLFLIAAIVSIWLFYSRKPAIAPPPQSLPAAPADAANDIIEATDAVETLAESEREPYFRKHYEADPMNQDRQTWKDYWHYVRQFYRGRFLTKGWDKHSEDLLAAIDESAEKQRLRVKLDVLGRHIAREWAKNNDTRKINTNDLIRWSRRMGTSGGQPAPDAAGLETIVDDIRREVDKRLGITGAAED